MANEQSDKSSTRQITVLASCSREQLDAWREEAFAGNKTAINRLHYWATCATPETTRARSSTAIAPSTLADKWPGERPKETDAEINAGALRQPRLLQDIKYEMQRVMMGARWDRPSWKRLIERMDEALAKPVSATALSEPWPIKLPVTYSERHHCIIGADGINVFALHLRMSVVDGHAIARIINREQFDIHDAGQKP